MIRRTAATHERIKEEIIREKAAALGRVGERLEAALAEVSALAQAVRAAANAAERERPAATTRGPGAPPTRRGWRS